MVQTLETALNHINETDYANQKVIIHYPESALGEDICVEYDNAQDALYYECEENYARDYIVECVAYLLTETIITISQEENSND